MTSAAIPALLVALWLLWFWRKGRLGDFAKTWWGEAKIGS